MAKSTVPTKGAAQASDPVTPEARVPASNAYWIGLVVAAAALLGFIGYSISLGSKSSRCCWRRSFRCDTDLAVLGSIVFGLTTPSEAAAAGALGGLLAAAYGRLNYGW